MCVATAILFYTLITPVALFLKTLTDSDGISLGFYIIQILIIQN